MKTFEKFSLGDIELKNRIVMAPLTRSRATENIPNDLMRKYYSQRASAGLIISEGTSPSPNGLGYPRIPGAFSEAQINGWKNVAEGVHEKGGKFFVQLMHTGRVTSSLNLPEGAKVLAPSSVQLGGEMYTDVKGPQPHDIPSEMTIADIKTTQDEHVNAAIELVKAGVDGIELHAANGYLLEQFINPKSNNRTDEYGGNYKNRARFVLEIAKRVADSIGGNKVGMRLSPYGVFNDMQGDYPELIDAYTFIAKELKKLNFAYIHIVDQRVAMGAPEFSTDIKSTIKNTFGGPVIVGGDVHTASRAEELIDEGYDLVYIGRPFISNPNLVEKLKANETLSIADPNTFYAPGEEGYVDYV